MGDFVCWKRGKILDDLHAVDFRMTSDNPKAAK